MGKNPNGRLAIHANFSGEYYAQRVVNEIKSLRDTDLRKELCIEKVSLQKVNVTVWPDSDLQVLIPETVRGEDAYLFQWFPLPPGQPNSLYTAQRNKEEFFQAVGGLLNSGIQRLTIVTPYVYAGRADVLDGRGVIGAELFCEELSAITGRHPMNAYCLDIHNQTVIGFYHSQKIWMNSVPVFEILATFLRENYPDILQDGFLVGPDLGSSKRIGRYSRILDLPMVLMGKRRLGPDKVKTEALLAPGSQIEGKRPIFIDDILQTGSTLAEGSEFLMHHHKTKKPYWFVTHPEITNLPRLDEMYNDGKFEKLLVGDTVQLPEREYFVQVPTSRVMAKIICLAHTNKSTSEYVRNDQPRT